MFMVDGRTVLLPLGQSVSGILHPFLCKGKLRLAFVVLLQWYLEHPQNSLLALIILLVLLLAAQSLPAPRRCSAQALLPCGIPEGTSAPSPPNPPPHSEQITPSSPGTARVSPGPKHHSQAVAPALTWASPAQALPATDSALAASGFLLFNCSDWHFPFQADVCLRLLLNFSEKYSTFFRE